MITMNLYYKSIIDQDEASVVICNTEHVIIDMNPAAVRNYAKRGGDKLIGQSLLACHNDRSVALIHKVVNWFQQSADHNRVHTFYNEKQNKDGYMVALRDADKKLIGYYEKHEFRTKDETPFYELDGSKNVVPDTRKNRGI